MVITPATMERLIESEFIIKAHIILQTDHLPADDRFVAPVAFPDVRASAEGLGRHLVDRIQAEEYSAEPQASGPIAMEATTAALAPSAETGQIQSGPAVHRSAALGVPI